MAEMGPRPGSEYLPPSVLQGAVANLRLGLLAAIPAFFTGLAAAASDSHVTNLEWILMGTGALVAAATAMAMRSAYTSEERRRADADQLSDAEVDLVNAHRRKLRGVRLE